MLQDKYKKKKTHGKISRSSYANSSASFLWLASIGTLERKRRACVVPTKTRTQCTPLSWHTDCCKRRAGPGTQEKAASYQNLLVYYILLSPSYFFLSLFLVFFFFFWPQLFLSVSNFIFERFWPLPDFFILFYVSPPLFDIRVCRSLYVCLSITSTISCPIKKEKEKKKKNLFF